MKELIRCITCDRKFWTDDQPWDCPYCGHTLMAELLDEPSLLDLMEVCR